jgi:hypothetical protein
VPGFFKPFYRPLLVMDIEKGPIFKLRPIDSNEIQPINKLAECCYKELIKQRDSAADHLTECKIELKKGDILVIDNHLTTHTRDVFEAYDDKPNRIILRAYVSDYNNLVDKIKLI